ncbi:MAG: excinuclease ABC subunit UvrA, partial [Patescibacteria group bacterium]
PWARASHRVGRQSWYWWIIEDIANRYGFSVNIPVKNLPPQIINLILYGETAMSSKVKNQSLKLKNNGGFEGVVSNLKRRWKETESDWTRQELERYMRIEKCRVCAGARLKEEALNVLITGKNIAEISALAVINALEFINKLFRASGPNSSADKKIILSLGKEISERLQFLIDVGLDYLTLDRESTTLAGGEAQRVRIATQIGSGLSGVIYVLDEPSVGLHPRDHFRLIKTLKNLRDLGNTVIVVEHDALTMKEANWIIDLGPGAGEKGGKVIFEGTYKQLLKSKTLTGEYLSGKRKVKVDGNRFKVRAVGLVNGKELLGTNQKPKTKNQTFCQDPQPKTNYLVIKGAKEHNLKNIDVEIPLRKFVCVSGVSGSGKSTLVNDILGRALQRHFYSSKEEPGQHKKILGIENLNKVVLVDQSPIGRTPRSNSATYTGVFSFTRELFSKTLEARLRGYKPGRFSFNVKGGRCEVCEGQGVKKIEMYFLSDIFVECEECQGSRYNKEALKINYKGKNIAEVLNMSVEQALIFFGNIPQIKLRLKTLVEVGLGYIKLGQSATTLSGGEAQRVKLATELAKKATGDTLYILDEPTTGLHFDDILKLLKVLKALVNKGNSVLVIEHNLDVLRNADWIIDLGPEGGENGGKIIAKGTLKEIISQKNVSHTGKWLKKLE